MAIQTTYGPYLTPGLPGMIADMRTRTAISRELMAASAGLPFGAVVLRGATDHTCAAFGTAGAGAFMGIAVLDPTVRPGAPAINTYVPGDTAAVLLKGVVWVTAGSATTPGAPAFYDGTGNLTSASAGNTAIPGATFETTAAAGGIAILRLS